MKLDLLIENARIVDGSGEASYKGAIGLKGDRIEKIWRGNEPDCEAVEVYDAKGMAVSPGFVDIHSHTDQTLHRYPKVESKILQGVTTDLGGNCGLSYAPLKPGQEADMEAAMGEAPYAWHSFGEFLDSLEAAEPSINLACGVGHGALRLAAVGFDQREATSAEMEDMKSMLADSIDEGAFMMSSGLIYPPGSYAGEDELAELCKVVADKGVYYATHMRYEGLEIVEGVREAIDTARRGGASLQISHHKMTSREFWGKSDITLGMIEKAKEEGMDVWVDQYPYVATSTSLSSNIPNWAFEGGIEALKARLRDPQTRAEIIKQADEGYPERWKNTVLSYAGLEEFNKYQGMNLEQIGEAMGCSGVEACVRIVAAGGNIPQKVHFAMCEEDIENIMKRSYVMIGSDGWGYDLDYPGIPHPRSFGTFPRVLSYYSRERGLFPLEEAVRKISGLPAWRIGLDRRGLIREGWFADLTIFNPDTICDNPSYENPKQPCRGIARVYVNGVLTAENGRHTGARSGRILRR